MLQLTYISSASRGIGAADVEHILSTSRRNNGANRISGLLVYDGRRFLQALEGDSEMVERTFARIRLDKRHRAIVLLSQREVDRREFGDWAMAYQQAVAASAKASMIEAVNTLTAAIPDANTRELFRGFARIDRHAA